MLARKGLITFLVDFLRHSSKRYISLQDLDYAIKDLIEENHISARQQQELEYLYEQNPEFLLSRKCRYFSKIKYYILPFLRK